MIKAIFLPVKLEFWHIWGKLCRFSKCLFYFCTQKCRKTNFFAWVWVYFLSLRFLEFWFPLSFFRGALKKAWFKVTRIIHSRRLITFINHNTYLYKKQCCHVVIFHPMSFTKRVPSTLQTILLATFNSLVKWVSSLVLLSVVTGSISPSKSP